jgi:hypothetical protein
MRAARRAEMPGDKKVSSFSIRWNIFDRDLVFRPSWRRRKTRIGSDRAAISGPKIAFCACPCVEFRTLRKGRSGPSDGVSSTGAGVFDPRERFFSVRMGPPVA